MEMFFAFTGCCKQPGGGNVKAGETGFVCLYLCQERGDDDEEEEEEETGFPPIYGRSLEWILCGYGALVCICLLKPLSKYLVCIYLCSSALEISP